MDIPVIARRVRDYLGVPLNVQTGWIDSEAAFEAWRQTLEQHGIAVFKDAFQNELLFRILSLR